MTEKTWLNTYIVYGLTNEEDRVIQSQLKKFNKIIAGSIEDIWAYPAFLIILNPTNLDDLEVKELNNTIKQIQDNGTVKIYLTTKDDRVSKLLNEEDKTLDTVQKIKKALKIEKERIQFYNNRNCFFETILLKSKISLLAARPAMGRKRLAIELAQKYMEIYPYKAYVFCVQPLSKYYLDGFKLCQDVEFIYEKNFDEICSFIKINAKENIFCVIADIDMLPNAKIDILYESIDGTDSKILITEKCSRELENRADLHPKVSDIPDFFGIRDYIDNVVLIYRRAYYCWRMDNKIEISIHNMTEITSEKFAFYWDFSMGLCNKKQVPI